MSENTQAAGPRTVVITGVSGGLGRAIAERLLAGGWRVYGSVRQPAQGQALVQALGAGFTPLCFDVTDGDAMRRAVSQVSQILDGQPLGALINNAGIIQDGPLLYQPIDEVARLMEVNLLGLLRVTQAFAPLLGAGPDARHPPGRIVNIGSAAGHFVVPFLGAYAASKHAVEGLSDALRLELGLFGVPVVVVVPGTLRTDLWGGREPGENPAYRDTAFAPSMKRLGDLFRARRSDGIEPAEVAEKVAKILAAPRPRSRYAVTRDPLVRWQVRLRALFDGVVDNALRKRLGLRS